MNTVSRIAGWIVATASLMNSTSAYGQHLGTAREFALGGATSLSRGVSGLDWNAATIPWVRDWEFVLSNYVPISSGNGGFVLGSTSIARRFLEDHAVAASYSPGKIAEFLIPGGFTFVDSNVVLQTSFDQRVVYAEPMAFGYSHRWGDEWSLGAAARLFTEKVTDTEYFIDSASTIRSRTVDYTGARWLVDLGACWRITSSWRIGTVVKNLLTVGESVLPTDVAQYRLTLPRHLRFGIARSEANIDVGLDADTEKRLTLGYNWFVARGSEEALLSGLAIRGAVIFNGKSRPIGEAIAAGVGGTFDFVDIDVSYLRFLSRESRLGSASVSTFDASQIRSVEFHPYAGDRVALTLTANLGRTRDPLVRIERVEILSAVFPSSSLLYSYSPIGKAYVRNVGKKPVEVRIQFYVERLMDAPTESRAVVIQPGEREEIPFYAIFNEDLQTVRSASLREGVVSVRIHASGDVEDKLQKAIVVHGRNDWNGDVNSLKYFLTPSDPDVINFTRSVLQRSRDQVEVTDPDTKGFVHARILFDEFAGKMTYVRDPKTSQDFVQYPAETLRLGGGDCDDMTVCYSTLLLSIGVPTAFVDVVPPDNPSNAHIFMMFDTGISARNAGLVTDNPKRIVIRKNRAGAETVWIPIETTATTLGFEESWRAGAKEYYEKAELGLGLAKGWVKIVDVQPMQ
jgi:hypothetical protein